MTSHPRQAMAWLYAKEAGQKEEEAAEEEVAEGEDDGGGSDREGNPYMQEVVRQVNAYRGTRQTMKNLDGTSSTSPTMKEH